MKMLRENIMLSGYEIERQSYECAFNWKHNSPVDDTAERHW